MEYSYPDSSAAPPYITFYQMLTKKYKEKNPTKHGEKEHEILSKPEQKSLFKNLFTSSKLKKEGKKQLEPTRETPKQEKKVAVIQKEFFTEHKETIINKHPKPKKIVEGILEEETKIVEVENNSQIEPTEIKETRTISPDSFSFYLKNIPNLPLLKEEEEKKLIKTARGKNIVNAQKAEETLLLSNLKLVISLAKKYVKYGCPIEDLVSEGNIGLKTAIEKYEPERGARLSTYAVWWIKQHLRKATNENTRTIRIPIYQQKTVRAIHATAAKLMEVTGHYPADEEIAEELGIKTHLVQNLRNLTVPMMSLQNPVGSGNSGDKENRTYEDIISDQSHNGDSPLERLTKKNNNQGIMALIEKRLNKKEQAVVKLRYGLADGEGNCKTLEEVGKELDLTRERIRQIQEQALIKLRNSLESLDACKPTLLGVLKD